MLAINGLIANITGTDKILTKIGLIEVHLFVNWFKYI